MEYAEVSGAILARYEALDTLTAEELSVNVTHLSIICEDADANINEVIRAGISATIMAENLRKYKEGV